MGKPLYKLDQITCVRKGRTVLDRASAEIPEGITCLVGRSGAGKSTLLRLLNRLADADSGSIYFHGKNIHTFNVLELRRRASLVPQIPIPFSGTVADNIRYGSSLAGLEPDTEKLLTEVSLDPSFGDRAANELSVGEQQRLMLARALALNPDVLLLDEPTSALDQTTTESIENTLLNLKTELNLPMVLVTHNQSQAERLADYTLHIEAGKISEQC